MTKIANVAPQLPPNMSVAAAMSAGYLSANVLIASINGVSVTTPASAHALIAAGVLDPSLPASALGFVTHGPNYGGD